MSHFTVLVPANDKDHLHKMLLPYHEYECTGYPEYVEFVPENLEELKEKFSEHGEEGQTFEEFIPSWCGAEKNDQGVWGHYTNPNAKWDWYSVGGRWSGLLLLKWNAVGVGENGEGGVFNSANTDPNRADAVLAGCVDWDKMRQNGVDAASKRYDRWHLFTHYSQEEMAQISKEDKKIYSNNLHTYDFLFVTQHEAADLTNLTKEQYVAKYGYNVGITYAFIDSEGKWHGRGEMGWFGISSDESDSYGQEWWNFVLGLSPEQKIFAVDCHI